VQLLLPFISNIFFYFLQYQKKVFSSKFSSWKKLPEDQPKRKVNSFYKYKKAKGNKRIF